MTFKFNENKLTDSNLIFEFEDTVPMWVVKSGEEQFKKFGFEYGHHGSTEDDGKPYFGKMLFLKDANHDIAKPHIALNILDLIRFKLLDDIDPNGIFIDIDRIAVNGQLPGQSPEKHIDSSDKENLWTAIYYASDSDGDTLFFQSLKNPQTQIYKADYKQGKIVIFPGCFLHQAMAPSTNWRISIGISFLWDTYLNKSIRYDTK